MKKRNNKQKIAASLTVILLLSCFSPLTIAETEDIVPHDISGSKTEHTYSDRDIAVSNLLKMGWTMDEINDLNENEILKYKDVLDYDTAESYICTYVDENNEENLVSVSKDVYDHILSKNETEKNTPATELSDMSSNGKLNISPIWSSEYYDSYAFEGKLKQKANLTWMGNNTYFTNYRCEWEHEPNVQNKDIMYIYNGGMKAKLNTTYFVYKYTSRIDGIFERVIEHDNYNDSIGNIKIYRYPGGIGYVFKFNSEEYVEDCADGTDTHRMYMSHDLNINEGQNSVVTNAGYYHNTSRIGSPEITDITSSGASISSIWPLQLGTPTLYLNAKNY